MKRLWSEAKVSLLILIFYLTFWIIKGVKKMKRILFSLLIIALVGGCATIPQDKPITSDQCFESKFNPFRLNPKEWKMVYQDEIAFFVKNPDAGKLPDYVAINFHPLFGIVAYAYLDGRNVLLYTMQEGCYKLQEWKEGQHDAVKKVLLKLRNGHEV